MKIKASLIGMCLLLPISAHAQSELWQYPPVYRDLEVLEDYEWWNPADTRMVVHPRDGTHWYEKNCCSDEDCKGFSTELVTEYDDGSAMLILPEYKNFPGMRVIFSNISIRERPKNARTDWLWHFCFTLYMDPLSHKTLIQTHCAYRPSPST